jgi:hypothetical protein
MLGLHNGQNLIQLQVVQNIEYCSTLISLVNVSILHSVVKYLLVLMDAELALLLTFLLMGLIIVILLKYVWNPFTSPQCKPDDRVKTWTSDCKPATCSDSGALARDSCVRYHHCDQQFGPDYTAFDSNPRNEWIKTFTKEQCLYPCTKKDTSCLYPGGSYCWDDDFERCFNVR